MKVAVSLFAFLFCAGWCFCSESGSDDEATKFPLANIKKISETSHQPSTVIYDLGGNTRVYAIEINLGKSVVVPASTSVFVSNTENGPWENQQTFTDSPLDGILRFLVDFNARFIKIAFDLPNHDATNDEMKIQTESIQFIIKEGILAEINDISPRNIPNIHSEVVEEMFNLTNQDLRKVSLRYSEGQKPPHISVLTEEHEEHYSFTLNPSENRWNIHFGKGFHANFVKLRSTKNRTNDIEDVKFFKTGNLHKLKKIVQRKQTRFGIQKRRIPRFDISFEKGKQPMMFNVSTFSSTNPEKVMKTILFVWSDINKLFESFETDFEGANIIEIDVEHIKSIQFYSDYCSIENICNDGQCVIDPSLPRSYRCDCPQEHTGFNCGCVKDKCKNGGKCRSISGTSKVECECPQLDGKQTEDCRPLVCSSEANPEICGGIEKGRCFSTRNGTDFDCECFDGYHNDKKQSCEETIDYCDASIFNTSTMTSSSGHASIKEHITLTCKSGYKLEGSEDFEPRIELKVACRKDSNETGIFKRILSESESIPTECVAIEGHCRISWQNQNSIEFPSSQKSLESFQVGEVFSYSCLKGFRFDENPEFDSITAECIGETAEFSKRMLECVVIEDFCKFSWKNPEVIHFEDSSKPIEMLQFEQSFVYSCKAGYHFPERKQSRISPKCTDSSWSGDNMKTQELPGCEKIEEYCRVPNRINGPKWAKIGDFIHLECPERFHVDAKNQTTSKCIEDGFGSGEGKWSHHISHCEATHIVQSLAPKQGEDYLEVNENFSTFGIHRLEFDYVAKVAENPFLFIDPSQTSNIENEPNYRANPISITFESGTSVHVSYWFGIGKNYSDHVLHIQTDGQITNGKLTSNVKYRRCAEITSQKNAVLNSKPGFHFCQGWNSSVEVKVYEHEGSFVNITDEVVTSGDESSRTNCEQFGDRVRLLFDVADVGGSQCEIAVGNLIFEA